MSGYTISDLNTVFTTLDQDGQAQFSITPLDLRSSIASAAGLIPNVQTVSYTLVLTDVAKCIVMNSASAVNLTIPPNSSVAFQVGVVITWYGLGAGLITFVPGAAVTIEKSSTTLVTRAQFAFGGIWQRAANTWVLWGDVA
jgi:hypothetical protein